MFICEECGRVTDNPDAEFCYHCGSNRGSKVLRDTIPQSYQPVPANGGGVIYADRNELRKIPLALILAFIPGLFDIFGLGHFIIGKWIKGLGFLSISGIYYYIKYLSGWDMVTPYLFIMSLGVFVIQMVDLYNGFREILNDSIL